MQDPRIAAFGTDVQKVIDHLHLEFAKLQTGRASALMVESIEVEAYGTKQPLKAVAGIMVEDARTLTIQPWDKSVLQAVEKALQKQDFGSSPVNDGVKLRLIFPPMTEERRQSLVKTVHHLAEEAKISIRHQRHELQEKFRQEKDEDVRETLLEALQKEVDSGNARIEESRKKKEQEVMTI